ncbi:TetR/AcrR family transcriptional regulator [Desulfopila aestuarii]|uniref:Transcriptional regulator, TetR family n=1 Tax=Desulfopila aestuarii DSM 18488 TaxID=1121416 RepID=A0A1M7Y6D3_9BACT|nr:TetR/AcrR family transcriptional regulator [Desulfopila aestuarii]SHO48151.1 transcriptional regulator, TetR family [Desulfopila aestuarii DSM 18488]
MPESSLDYTTFKKKYATRGADIPQQVYLANQDTMRIKKEKTAVDNLEKILSAVFSISSKKGFHAMTMRDLSQKSGISLGALYPYFESKDQLLAIILEQGRSMVCETLEMFSREHAHPLEKLRVTIKAHIFLSELMRPWFYFAFMEVRNLKAAEFEAVKAMEERTQKILCDILEQGEAEGVFRAGNHALTASMIKALQQEWYLKRWKYTKQQVPVDQYAEQVMEMVEKYCCC